MTSTPRGLVSGWVSRGRRAAYWPVTRTHRADIGDSNKSPATGAVGVRWSPPRRMSTPGLLVDVEAVSSRVEVVDCSATTSDARPVGGKPREEPSFMSGWLWP
jgi:hypothetical protein